ncbi:hypothetical protein Hypma_010048 [Hypsizygus marmoreus]|uniref:ER membrane protein complex subunit 10 n=1 Tax=Hypsizygus marmoreus TaxID=39966 RepID=A0A369JNK2_HYPMA|nr:hypothetical protein Hypma_010048 [Hypsizygus marmoreus]
MRIAAAVLGLLSIPLVCAQHSHLRLLHRLYHPVAAQAPFSERGSLKVAPNYVAFQSAPSYAADLRSFAEALHTVEDKDLLLYQVALERHGDTAEAQWDISSVKVCHLSQITSEYIHLHTLDPRNPNPHALDYFVSPIPHNGACPDSRSRRSTKHSPQESPFQSLATVNTTVILKGARFPPLPQLATPPPISAEGEPIVPVPEKSFLQKYWMYIVGLILFTLITSGGEEEKPRK